MIWNAAALEGNSSTLPEVQTLLEGVTAGGKRTEDQKQILNLSDGYSFVDELVGNKSFDLSMEISDDIHARVVVDEAIESGHFRGAGSVMNGGTVRLAGGGLAQGFPHGEGGALLIKRFEQTVD